MAMQLAVNQCRKTMQVRVLPLQLPSGDKVTSHLDQKVQFRYGELCRVPIPSGIAGGY